MKKTTATKKKSGSGSKEAKGGDSPSQLIDARIKALSDWRGETLARVRSLIKQADPEVVEAWKWRGVPVWEHAGIICTGETYKTVVKMTFARWRTLQGLFNASLEGNTRRAIDFHEGDKIDEKAFKALIRAAVALNISVRAAARPVRSQKETKERLRSVVISDRSIRLGRYSPISPLAFSLLRRCQGFVRIAEIDIQLQPEIPLRSG